MNSLPVRTVFCALFHLTRAMQVGTRVFFWDTRGQVVRGVVQSTSRGADVCGIYVLAPLHDASAFKHTGHPDGCY